MARKGFGKQSRRRRLGAVLLSAALVAVQLPGTVLAEQALPEDGSIASFEALAEDVAVQEVVVGTAYEDLNLPDTVMAEVYRVTEEAESEDGDVPGGDMVDGAIVDEDILDEDVPDEDIPDEDIPDEDPSGEAEDKASPSNSRSTSEPNREKTVSVVRTFREAFPVSWDSDVAYEADVPGTCQFTANAGGGV